MKKTIITIVIVLFLAAILTSCTNDIEDPVKIFKGESWEEIFEEYWTVMDEEYVHFQYEDTDWDTVYKEYAPLFRNLDYSSSVDCFRAFGYFNHILLNLSDYHYRLIIETKSGYTYDARPSFLQKWVKNGGDVDDLPVIRTGENSRNYTYYSVSGGKDSPVTDEVRTEEYINKAVDGYSEIVELSSAFHNPDEMSFSFRESCSMEFLNHSSGANMYYKFVIAPFALDDGSGTKWFYGVTDNNVLYIYFSMFVKPGFFDYFYNLYNFEELTEEEQEAFEEEYGREKMCYDRLMESSAAEEKERVIGLGRFATYLRNAINNGKITLADGSSVDINGIVIDLRNNGGGYAVFFHEFMGQFFASDKTVGYTQTRIGYSRYDMGPWVEYELGTYNSGLKEDYQGRVAVITNGFSVSCSELTTIASKLLPHSMRFGSTTFGGTCALASRAMYHSGPYEHGSLTVRTTSVRYMAFDGTSYESRGIVPDVQIPLDTARDVRFETAVKWAATGTLPSSAT